MNTINVILKSDNKDITTLSNFKLTHSFFKEKELFGS